MTMRLNLRRAVHRVFHKVAGSKVIDLELASRPIEAQRLDPYRCACRLVKAGEVDECPVHVAAMRMPEGIH
ncbi:MAG TPA: hypothetical protein V6D17_02705 [Candidatus Obscuribacterales bacterium]